MRNAIVVSVDVHIEFASPQTVDHYCAQNSPDEFPEVTLHLHDLSADWMRAINGGWEGDDAKTYSTASQRLLLRPLFAEAVDSSTAICQGQNSKLGVNARLSARGMEVLLQVGIYSLMINLSGEDVCTRQLLKAEVKRCRAKYMNKDGTSHLDAFRGQTNKDEVEKTNKRAHKKTGECPNEW